MTVERQLGKEEYEFFGQFLVKMVEQLFFHQVESVMIIEAHCVMKIKKAPRSRGAFEQYPVIIGPYPMPTVTGGPAWRS